jgi:hypothetical protein
MYKEVEEAQSKIFWQMFDTKDMTVFLNGVRRAVNAIDGQTITPKIEWAVKHVQKSIKEGKKSTFVFQLAQSWVGTYSKTINRHEY